MADRPNFERSISLNDLDSSLRVRELIQVDVVTPEDETKHCHLKSASVFTFVLKSFTPFSLDFKKFLCSYLLDVGIYKELEVNKLLNWCPALFPMVPILTMGDGNCLMHAASIGMWAVNDRYHILRKLVYNAILEDTQRLFHKRWQREHELTNLRVHGYSMTEEQWIREWQIIIQLVSQEEYPVGHGMQYGSLEEIHIFILANILRRTIIVISSDTLRGNYDESLSPVHFPGIYLPLNWDPIDCIKTPLVIGFAQGHFTSIVSFEDGVFDQGEVIVGDDQNLSKIHGVPLQKYDGTPLPLHFLFEDEVDLRDGLLRQYLDCTKLSHKNPHDDRKVVTLVARFHFEPVPECISTLVDGFYTRAGETYQLMVQAKDMQAGNATPSLPLEQCKTKDCEFFGTSETLFLCSKCLEKHFRNEAKQVVPYAPPMELIGAGAPSREEYYPSRTAGPSAPFREESSPRNTTPQQQQTMQLQLQQEKMISQEPQHKKCITNGCKYNANEETGNLCYRCYESELQAEQQTASIVSLNLQAKPCANSVNGCLYFGIVQQEDFCSRCYRRFCLEMESRSEGSNDQTASQTSPVSSPQPANICQTVGCSRSGCPELYGRCIQCYSECIRSFITSHESGSLQTFASSTHPPPSSQPTPSSQREPPEPLQLLPASHMSSQPTQLARLASASQFEQPSPTQGRLCTFSCCQNEGVSKYNGKCDECYRINPMDCERLATMATKTTDVNRPSNVTGTPPTTAVAHAPTVTAGLPSGEPRQKGKRIYCETPKCYNPLGECNGILCTKCIMGQYEKHAKTSQQQLYVPPSAGASGSGMTEGQIHGQNPEAGLGEAGVSTEKVGHNQLQSSASEEHKVPSAASIARQRLPPLKLPPVAAKTAWNSPQAGSPMTTGTPASSIKCVAPNCPFFGNAEHNYYCSTCYDQSREEWQRISNMAHLAMRRPKYQDPLIQAPVSWEQRPTAKPGKIRKCALTHCYNLETPGSNGLCDKCHRTALLSEKEWQSTNRTRHERNEPQRQQPIHAHQYAVPTTRGSTAKPLKKAFVDAGAPCKKSGCLRFGTAAKQGLCDPCFEQFQREQLLRTTSASGFSSVPTRVCVAQQRTAPPNDWSNMTKAPFMKTPMVTSTFSAQSPIPVSQISTGVFGAGSGPLSNRCMQDGCKMTGTTELRGLCSRCFADYTRISSYPESVPDLKDSPEAIIMTNPSTVSLLNGMTFTSTPTTATTTVTGGLTTLQPGTPRVCTVAGCDNYVNPCTMDRCRDCLAKYYPNFTSPKDQEEN